MQPNCGDGATHHLRTFVHSGQRVTLSVAQLPAGQELPGGDRGQVSEHFCAICYRFHMLQCTCTGVESTPLIDVTLSSTRTTTPVFSVAQMWIWARPLPAGDLPCLGVRRVALSADAVCISFGEL